MGVARGAKKKKVSTGTGRFVLCHDAQFSADHQVWIEVKEGQSGCHFVRCSLCGDRSFFSLGSAWRRGSKSREEVLERTAYTVILPADGPPIFPAQEVQ